MVRQRPSSNPPGPREDEALLAEVGRRAFAEQSGRTQAAIGRLKLALAQQQARHLTAAPLRLLGAVAMTVGLRTRR